MQLLLCEPPGCMCECMGEALEVNILSQCLLPDLALSGDTAVFHRGGVTPELTSSLYTEWSMRKVGPLAWKKPSPTSHFSLQITPSWQSVHVFTLGLFISEASALYVPLSIMFIAPHPRTLHTLPYILCLQLFQQQSCALVTSRLRLGAVVLVLRLGLHTLRRGLSSGGGTLKSLLLRLEEFEKLFL